MAAGYGWDRRKAQITGYKEEDMKLEIKKKKDESIKKYPHSLFFRPIENKSPVKLIGVLSSPKRGTNRPHLVIRICKY